MTEETVRTEVDGKEAQAKLPPKRWLAARLTVRAIQVRLRFVGVLAIAFLVVGQWDALRNYWDRFTRAARGANTALQSVSSDTEYFCPMDPGVVSEWPGKCGVCNMALVRRKRGEAVPLPSGIVARMQFSPYRLQLAGVQTAPVTYQPLARTVSLVGTVLAGGDGLGVEAEAFDRDLAWLKPGQKAEIRGVGLDGLAPVAGKVRAVAAAKSAERHSIVRIAVDDPENVLRAGMPVTARVACPVAEREPFRSLPAGAPALRKGDIRALYVCPRHTEVLRETPGRCPVDQTDELERRPLLINQRVGWWCPMHPLITSDSAGKNCPECGGMVLVPRVITYRPPGEVLAIPESAVVDTGERTVVYVERMPGMFDGVEVALGPRCGDAYPVASGLEPGDRVATAGAFLIDAETRLNPSLAASYFGAGRGTSTEEVRRDEAARPNKLSAEDRALVASQKTCPVTGKPLGSMGPPVRVMVSGRPVMLCCDGCEVALKKNAGKYLPRVP
jgi:hypothetical protein